MLEIILKDIADIYDSFIWGLLAAAAFALPLSVFHALRVKRWAWLYLLKWYAFFAYVILLFQVAWLSREPGSRTTTDLIPLSTWGTTLQSHAYVLENFIMFLPMGFLLPCIHRFFRKGWRAVLSCLAISIAIELTQYVTQRGYLQTDDVLMNTLGGICGYFLWWLLARCFSGLAHYLHRGRERHGQT